MFWTIIWFMLGVYIIDILCDELFHFSPIEALKSSVQKALNSSEERQRLLELEEKEADKKLKALKRKEDLEFNRQLAKARKNNKNME